MRRESQAGYSLIEVMVTSAVILIVALSVGQQLIFFKKFKERERTLDAEALLVQGLLDQIRSRIELYPKDFEASADSSTPLSTLVSNLQSQNNWKYAWSSQYFGVPSGCTNCPGRATVLIQQAMICQTTQTCQSGGGEDMSEWYPGLYRVRVVLRNPEIFKAHPNFAKEYSFTVVSK